MSKSPATRWRKGQLWISKQHGVRWKVIKVINNVAYLRMYWPFKVERLFKQKCIPPTWKLVKVKALGL